VRGYRFLGALILLLVVILLNLPAPASLRVKAEARDSFVPFESLMWVILDRAHEAGSLLFRAREVVSEQSRLTAEVARLRDENRMLRSLESENRELRNLLGFKARQKYDLLLCSVIARGGVNGWWQTVQLDRGTADGIRPDLAVITPDGLVGHTVQVSRQTTTVLLVTDPSCRVGSRFTRTGAFGISRGLGTPLRGELKLEMVCASRPVRVDYVDKENIILDRDDVVTSGLGGVYPEGIPLGRVLKSEMDSSGLYRRVEVMPTVDLDALRFVFVVRERRGAS
jgi:rod shape-determining protein MreC